MKEKLVRKEDFESAMMHFVELFVLYTSQLNTAQKSKGVNFIKAVIDYNLTGKYLLSLLHVEGEKLKFYDMAETNSTNNTLD